MTNFYQKIQSKVTSLAWHPLKEIYLAYSTFEGRVSITKSQYVLYYVNIVTLVKTENGNFYVDKYVTRISCSFIDIN